jgi:hypothetical protein
MSMCTRHIIPGLLCILLCGRAHAEVIDLEGTVKAVDVDARTVTIERKTPSGTRTLTLEVAKKAGDVSDLKPGSPISFSYDPDLEIVTKIGGGDHEGDEKRPPQVRTVEEIPGAYASVTEDGLQVVYEANNSFAQGGEIWEASRVTGSDPFIGRKQILVGRHPSISGDGLEVVFIRKRADRDEWVLNTAARKDRTAMFSGSREIDELRGFIDIKCPHLSADGLRLAFMAGPSMRLWTTSRPNPTGRWSDPEPLPEEVFGSRPGDFVTWPFLTPDPNVLIAVREGKESDRKAYIFRREDLAARWRTAGPIELPGVAGNLRAVRYSPAFNELFFTELAQGRMTVRVLRPFSPPWIKK